MSFLTKLAKQHKGKVEKVSKGSFGGKKEMEPDEHRDVWVGFLNKTNDRNKVLLSILGKNERVKKIQNIENRMAAALEELDVIDGKAKGGIGLINRWNKSGSCFVLQLKRAMVSIPFGKDDKGDDLALYSLQGMSPEKGLKEAISILDSVVKGMEKGEMDAEIIEWIAQKTTKIDKAEATKKANQKERAKEAGVSVEELLAAEATARKAAKAKNKKN